MKNNTLYKTKIYVAVSLYVIVLIFTYFISGFILSIFFALTLLLLAYIIHIIVNFAELKFNEKDEKIQKHDEEKKEISREYNDKMQVVLNALRKERQEIEILKHRSIQNLQALTNDEIEKIRNDAEQRILELQQSEQIKLQEIEQKYKDQIITLEKEQSSKNGWIPKEEWLKLKKEKEEKGRIYELRVGEHFEIEGYQVEYRGINLGKRDGGIDLIARKEEEIILIQCKNWKGNIKIKQADIRKFYGDCSKYIEDNQIARDGVQYRYVIPSRGLLDYQAERFFIENHTRIRYLIIDAEKL